MFSSPTTNITVAREFFHDNLTYKDVYFSLAIIFATFYIYYNRVSYKPTLLASHKDSKTVSSEKDPLENCDYANIKVTKLLIHPIKVFIRLILAPRVSLGSFSQKRVVVVPLYLKRSIRKKV